MYSLEKNTVWKMSVFEAIQSKCGKIRTRITPNTETFHVVKDKVIGGYECVNYQHPHKEWSPKDRYSAKPCLNTDRNQYSLFRPDTREHRPGKMLFGHLLCGSTLNYSIKGNLVYSCLANENSKTASFFCLMRSGKNFLFLFVHLS